VAFNYNRKNINVVDFFGFRIETLSKLQALYFMSMKVNQFIQMGIDEQMDMNIKFYEIGKSKERQTSQIRDFKRKYSKMTTGQLSNSGY